MGNYFTHLYCSILLYNKNIMAKEILRKCIGCFTLNNRDAMIKITRESSSGKIFINPNSKIFGRSVYLCYNNLCVENSLKKNKLSKFLKADLSEEFKEKLRTIHSGKQEENVML